MKSEKNRLPVPNRQPDADRCMTPAEAAAVVKMAIMKNATIPEQRPPHMLPPELDWVERCAIENLKSRVQTADVLAKEAAATLLLLLGGTGGALAYARPLLDGAAAPSAWVAAAVAGWLAVLAMLLVLGCLMAIRIPAVYNQPNRLLARDPTTDSLDDWRYGELLNLQDRIDAAVQRNNRIALRLNVLRALAAATPVVVGVAARLVGAA